MLNIQHTLTLKRAIMQLEMKKEAAILRKETFKNEFRGSKEPVKWR